MNLSLDMQHIFDHNNVRAVNAKFPGYRTFLGNDLNPDRCGSGNRVPVPGSIRFNGIYGHGYG